MRGLRAAHTTGRTGNLQLVDHGDGTTAYKPDVPYPFGLDANRDGLKGRWSSELFASAGFDVAEPDYLGMGRWARPPGHMVANAEVSASLDLLRAATAVAGRRGGKLQQFYTDLFGWDLDAGNPLRYGMVAAGDGGIGGGGGPTIDGTARTMFYVGVEDLHARIEEAQALGATVMPPMDVPGGPSIAMFTDPDGDLIGLMKRP